MRTSSCSGSKAGIGSRTSIRREVAAARTIEYITSPFRLDRVAPGVLLFINFTRQMIMEDLYSLLPRDRVVMSLLRGRMCERLGERLGLGDDVPALFLVGSLSLLDAILDRPASDTLAELSLSEAIVSGILRDDSRLGRIRHLVMLYEAADWARLAEEASQAGVSASGLSEAYLLAADWVHGIL